MKRNGVLWSQESNKESWTVLDVIDEANHSLVATLRSTIAGLNGLEMEDGIERGGLVDNIINTLNHWATVSDVFMGRCRNSLEPAAPKSD